jgi:hypothetical protein
MLVHHVQPVAPRLCSNMRLSECNASAIEIMLC